MSHYIITPNLIANGNISPATFITGDTSNDQWALQASAGGVTIGITFNTIDTAPGIDGAGTYHAVATEAVSAYGPGAYCLLNSAAGGWSEFQFLKSDGSGNGVPANPGDIVGAFSATANPGSVTSPAWVLPPGTRCPSTSAQLAVTITATPLALTSSQNGITVFSNQADGVVQLPAPALGYRVRVVSAAASATLQGGSLGTYLQPFGTEKIYGDNFTAAAGKGAVNTAATAHQGDTIEVISDGTNWWIANLVGTWAVHA